MSDFNLSTNKAAEALGLDARTVKKRIAAANLKPSEMRGSFKLYFLGDVARICFADEDKKTAYEVESLGPKSRDHHYASENKRIELLKKTRELIPYNEAADQFSTLAQTFSKFFPTMIDDLEQTQGFTPEQLQMIQDHCDTQRRLFFNMEFSTND